MDVSLLYKLFELGRVSSENVITASSSDLRD
eukprot:SAG22_NODE_17334_length_306_cov_29.173913_1_plen_30_part_10